jgi:AraC family L-rhamnose operon transcriptional activator RhaR
LTTHAHAVPFTADRYIPAQSIVGFFRAHHYLAIPWHDHDFYELGIIESGSGHHVTDVGIDSLGRGTVVFVPPGVEHEYRGCHDVWVYNCFFRAELDELELVWAFRDTRLGPLFNPTGLSPSRSRSPVIVQLGEPDLRAVIDALEAIRTAPPAARTRAHELGHLLIALDLIGAARQTSEHPDGAYAVPAVVTAAVDALERDIAFHWTLADIATRLFVGPFHLSRMFRRYLGMPPMQYLAHRRAERAAALLAGTDETVAAIGAAVGWPDPAHFSRRFRSLFGVGPRAYRRRHRQPSRLTASSGGQ